MNIDEKKEIPWKDNDWKQLRDKLVFSDHIKAKKTKKEEKQSFTLLADAILTTGERPSTAVEDFTKTSRFTHKIPPRPKTAINPNLEVMAALKSSENKKKYKSSLSMETRQEDDKRLKEEKAKTITSQKSNLLKLLPDWRDNNEDDQKEDNEEEKGHEEKKEGGKDRMEVIKDAKMISDIGEKIGLVNKDSSKEHTEVTTDKELSLLNVKEVDSHYQSTEKKEIPLKDNDWRQLRNKLVFSDNAKQKNPKKEEKPSLTLLAEAILTTGEVSSTSKEGSANLIPPRPITTTNPNLEAIASLKARENRKSHKSNLSIETHQDEKQSKKKKIKTLTSQKANLLRLAGWDNDEGDLKDK